MADKPKKLYLGFGLMIGFAIVLIFFFLPLYNGKNGLNYLDNLYNSMSKGSAYYIPEVKKDANKFMGNEVSVTLKMSDIKQAEQTASLFKAAGAETALSESTLKVEGDLGKILGNAVEDADAMYKNEGKKVSSRYGYEERQVLYNWWKAFQGMDKDLGKQKKFKEGKIIVLVQQKALEPSYNYYQIEPESVGDRWGTVIFSLLFYVVYTMWYGFAFLFMFEGWGLQIGH
jgi:hypothetical protein